MVKIVGIKPGSIAEEYGLKVGDRIVKINGQTIKDYIDFQYESSEDVFYLEIINQEGKSYTLEIKRSYAKPLGIELDGIIYDQLKQCQNNCLFCFVQQQPAGLRHSLLLKDDDYRFSFLQGSFITLTNLSAEEINRIINYRLSPLNISVHTTNPELRKQLMKNPQASQILTQLKQLAAGGISFNAQLVLCPGFNDGKELDRTIKELLDFYPHLLSLGVVPVGLTKYRQNLFPLKSYDAAGARQVLKQIKGWQQRIKGKLGENLIYAADEFYLLAGEDIPAYEEYNGFPQIENGIGLTRLFWHDLLQLEEQIPREVSPKELLLLTGVLGNLVWQPVKKRFDRIKGLKLEILTVENKFFGPEVTVTGLLTGQDILASLLLKEKLPRQILIPSITLNEQGLFLDDLSIKDLEEKFPQQEFIICQNLGDVLEVITSD